MKNVFYLVVIVLLATAGATAQSLSKSDVLMVKRKSMGAIQQDGQVKGYYSFYIVDKKDRNNVNYLLSVTDENLHEIKSLPITRPNTYFLLEAAFNGTNFAFLFYDVSEKTLEILGYDLSLKPTGKVNKDVSGKITAATYEYVAMGHEAQQSYLVGIPGSGFIHYGMKSDARGDYEIEFYDNNIKKKWGLAAPDDEYDFENAGEAFVDGGYIGSLTIKRKGVMSMDLKFGFLVQSLADGKKVFEIPMETPRNLFALSDAFYDKDKQQFIIFGEYYSKDDNVVKDKSKGFIAVTVDMKGKVTAEKTTPWSAISAKVDAKYREQFNSTNILFHNFIRTNDGHLFATGEQFDKGGIPMAVKIKVYNIVILEFDQDFAINKAMIFEKDRNDVEMPRGFVITSTKVLSYYAKSIGGFDYVFTNETRDKSTFLISYINYDREKGQKSKNVLGSIVYTPEKTFTVDKLDMNRKSSWYNVFPAKEGYVMVSEYFEKEKKIDNRLEKVNF